MPQEPQVQNGAPAQGLGERATISPELVKEVADKVYALLLKDLRIARERGRSSATGFQRKGQTQ